jgi:hypothetical protein
MDCLFSGAEPRGEKTSRLADASRDFAQMAKELSKKIPKRWAVLVKGSFFELFGTSLALLRTLER